MAESPIGAVAPRSAVASYVRRVTINDLQLLRYGLMCATVLFAFINGLRIPGPRGPVYGPLVVMLGIESVVECVGAYTSLNGIRNNPMFNAYVLVEFVLLLWLVFRLRPHWRTALGAALVLGVGAWALSFGRRGNAHFMFTDAIMVMSLLLAVFFLVLLWQLAESSDEPLTRRSHFWLFLGLVIYFGALFPIIGPLEYLWDSYPALTRNLYIIITVLAITRHVLTGVAAVMERRHRGPHP